MPGIIAIITVFVALPAYLYFGQPHPALAAALSVLAVVAVASVAVGCMLEPQLLPALFAFDLDKAVTP
ncbi:hypothetical protein [Brevibacterium aurantiacum]|uniref:Uncharacterized protein n=1 Tax=Brevibacterium aurantiacum TaxID=273384 RepID=A0A2H1KN02_BREAU|nr:hypothetical protein [Brevibacterium aurantiacum]SMY01127.1 hypothetical protein BAURA63_03507 [Brevibacterium aurantiacum]